MKGISTSWRTARRAVSMLSCRSSGWWCRPPSRCSIEAVFRERAFDVRGLGCRKTEKRSDEKRLKF